MGKLVNLLSSGVGLASEAIANRKRSKTPTPVSSSMTSDHAESSSAAGARTFAEAPPQYVEVSDEHADELVAQGKAEYVDEKHVHTDHSDEDPSDEEDDEEHWQLDEAARGSEPEGPEDQPAQSEAVLADEFMRNHPPPAYTTSGTPPRGRLPCPVIIPQRRPKDKKRGFVRAYAPVLAGCGIDQATFLEFLKDFHQASKASGTLQVINVAGQIAGLAPTPIAMGVSIAVQVTVGVAMEVQRRSRSNSFLDRINREFFEPRGLYCLIMTYKPDSTEAHEEVDITQSISTNTAEASSAMKQQFKNLRISSGKTYGELELPEAAPLIFPGLEEIAADPSAEGVKKQNKLKSSQKFVADYFDRRAQAQYASENPGSQLSAGGVEPKFANRWADPSSKATSGGLINFATGGLINPRERRREKRARRRGEEITPETGGRGRQKRQGPLRRVLQKNVLYMMIVNLPSEEELTAAREALASQAAQK